MKSNMRKAHSASVELTSAEGPAPSPPSRPSIAHYDALSSINRVESSSLRSETIPAADVSDSQTWTTKQQLKCRLRTGSMKLDIDKTEASEQGSNGLETLLTPWGARQRRSSAGYIHNGAERPAATNFTTGSLAGRIRDDEVRDELTPWGPRRRGSFGATQNEVSKVSLKLTAEIEGMNSKGDGEYVTIRDDDDNSSVESDELTC